MPRGDGTGPFGNGGCGVGLGKGMGRGLGRGLSAVMGLNALNSQNSGVDFLKQQVTRLQETISKIENK